MCMWVIMSVYLIPEEEKQFVLAAEILMPFITHTSCSHQQNQICLTFHFNGQH